MTSIYTSSFVEGGKINNYTLLVDKNTGVSCVGSRTNSSVRLGYAKGSIAAVEVYFVHNYQIMYEVQMFSNYKYSFSPVFHPG